MFLAISEAWQQAAATVESCDTRNNHILASESRQTRALNLFHQHGSLKLKKKKNCAYLPAPDVARFSCQD
jgi:hypothetical protein